MVVAPDNPWASLYADAKSTKAAAAAELSSWIVPFTTPGGNPVTETPGVRPTSPLTRVPPVLVTVACAKAAKLVAAPRSIGDRLVAALPVLKVHTKVGSGLPARSRAPVIAAVKVVLAASGLVGVKVTIMSGTS